jgi:hypothetical protein
VRISDIETGKALKSGSVDIRGNSDQSWERGLKFLLEEHVSRRRGTRWSAALGRSGRAAGRLAGPKRGIVLEGVWFDPIER